VKIAFLAHNLVGQGGLVGGQNFIAALFNAGYKHQYLITIPQNCGYEDITLPNGSEYYVCPPTDTLTLKQRFALESRVVPSAVRKFKADVVMGLGNHGLTNIDCPQAIWVRNGYLVYPYKHFATASLRAKLKILIQRRYFARTLKKTGLLFCQTPIMKKRIADYYKFDDNKIEILPNAISDFISKNPSNTAAELKGIEKNKFNCLVLSQYYVHKNPDIIMLACQKFEEKLQGIRFITTIAKKDHINAAKFLKKLSQEPKLSSLICNVGQIPHHQISDYYNNIQLVIMPTLMESFSVTYLEAMYFGVPMLTTDLDFAHYLCGNAAWYYAPWSVGDFVNRLLELKSDATLRQQLVDNAKTQISNFRCGWNDMTKIAISGLEGLAKPGGW
jgi:glycosyltransferase involved in cell wall biosynthesis